MFNMNDDVGCRVVSIVSGKGGSGKTMVAATMTRVLDSLGLKVLLVDADYGTAGLTYYMGLATVPNISVGLSGLEDESNIKEALPLYCQPMEGFSSSMFIGVGDHRRHLRDTVGRDLTGFFYEFVMAARAVADVVLIDCRGGIDDESLAVCHAVDDVLIVAETDTTSFQATQYLVDVLSEYGLSRKVSGFLINKVFDDPSAVARAGTASFRARYLDSIPFDLDATKSFLVGDVPGMRGMFSSQVWHVLYKLMPYKIFPPAMKSLSFNDYRGLSVRDNDSLLGGVFISFICLGLASIVVYSEFGVAQISSGVVRVSVVFLSGLAIVSGVEPVRRAIGRGLSFYQRTISRLFFGIRR